MRNGFRHRSMDSIGNQRTCRNFRFPFSSNKPVGRQSAAYLLPYRGMGVHGRISLADLAVVMRYKNRLDRSYLLFALNHGKHVDDHHSVAAGDEYTPIGKCGDQFFEFQLLSFGRRVRKSDGIPDESLSAGLASRSSCLRAQFLSGGICYADILFHIGFLFFYKNEGNDGEKLFRIRHVKRKIFNMQYALLRETRPGTICPLGHLKLFLERQYQGLSGHYKEMGYPYDSCLWAGKIENVHFQEGVHQGVQTPVTDLSLAWWPYEQTAYLLDGILRLSMLIDAPELAQTYRRNLEYLLAHSDENNMLGHCYHSSHSEWPMAVFFKSVIAYCDKTGDRDVIEAFHRHYSALPLEVLGQRRRNSANIEGVLKLYEWTGDTRLLDKAVAAYRLNDELSLRADDIYYDLNDTKLRSEQRLTLHGVTFAEMLKLPVLLYMATGEHAYLDAAKLCLKKAYRDHGQPGGQLSCNEFLSGRDPLQGFETCVTSDMMWTLGYFVMSDGEVSAADRMEKLVYNALPGAVTGDFTALQYLSAVNQTVATPFSNNVHMNYGECAWRQYRPGQFPQCCSGNLQRIMPNFVMRSWMLNLKDGAPVATLYGPTEFHFEYHSVTGNIREETQYPFDDQIDFLFTVSETVEMPFGFRIPEWSKSSELFLNGSRIELKMIPGTFAEIRRRWNSGDRLTLVLHPQTELKRDRQWCWFERGALVYSYAIPAQEIRENDSRFSPRSFLPKGDWNYAVTLTTQEAADLVPQKRESAYPYETAPLVLRIPVEKLRGGSELDCNRYTPQVPLFQTLTGEREELELVPYGIGKLRITAFPDGIERHELPVVAAYIQGPFPYNQKLPLDKQIFAPEFDTEDVYCAMPRVQRNPDQFFDLVRHFCVRENHLAYLMLRIWSDVEGEAVFAIGAASAAQCFIDGVEVFRTEPVQEAELMEPQWFRHSVKKGYNWLLVKVAAGTHCYQYRQEWGVRLTVFTEKKPLQPQGVSQDEIH